MVEVHDGIVHVGFNYDDFQNLIKLTLPDGQWQKLKQKTKNQISLHVAFLVPDDIVNCHY
jgi:hypothetical protein